MYAGHSFTFLVGAKMKDARNIVVMQEWKN